MIVVEKKEEDGKHLPGLIREALDQMISNASRRVRLLSLPEIRNVQQQAIPLS